jgi:hypothetical protein
MGFQAIALPVELSSQQRVAAAHQGGWPLMRSDIHTARRHAERASRDLARVRGWSLANAASGNRTHDLPADNRLLCH